MKKLVILTIGLFLAAASAHALDTPVNASVKSFSSVPVAISTVTPEVSSYYVGDKVELAFVVNEKGKAVDITSATKADPELVKTLSEAVSKWTFTPAYRNGTPVSTKVLLPVVIKG